MQTVNHEVHAMKRLALVIGTIAAAVVLAVPGTASAVTVTPFQLAPAPFGNPNGSFDVPAIRCGVEIGKARGVATVTGRDAGRWGCLPYVWVRWLNVSTGATGAAKMTSGLNGIPPQAMLRTGVGQVVVTIDAKSPVSPGLATVWVP